MIKHVWSVLCKESLINQKNNNVSLLEVIEQIEIGFSIPTQLKDQAVNIPFEFTLVSLFFREGDSKSEEKIRLKLNFIDPKNKSLIIQRGEVVKLEFQGKTFKKATKIKIKS